MSNPLASGPESCDDVQVRPTFVRGRYVKCDGRRPRGRLLLVFATRTAGCCSRRDELRPTGRLVFLDRDRACTDGNEVLFVASATWKSFGSKGGMLCSSGSRDTRERRRRGGRRASVAVAYPLQSVAESDIRP